MLLNLTRQHAPVLGRTKTAPPVMSLGGMARVFNQNACIERVRMKRVWKEMWTQSAKLRRQEFLLKEFVPDRFN